MNILIALGLSYVVCFASLEHMIELREWLRMRYYLRQQKKLRGPDLGPYRSKP